ncbi:MAG: HEAT repeat domain-containing protein [Anaerolineales bacterium]|nr:MAG: HEAT repeat domain-containing protein [Anaerolineales bacterium]
MKTDQEHKIQSLLKHISSGDDTRAEDALHALAAYGEGVLPLLMQQLQSDDGDQRWWATAALALIDHREARLGLLRSLSDRDASVRQCAAFGLRQQPNPEAIPALIAALGDRDRLLARLAADALTALGEQAISPLTEALRAHASTVRSEAARALSMMDDTTVIPPLFAALDDPSPLVAHWAEQGLSRLGVGMTFFDPKLG